MTDKRKQELQKEVEKVLYFVNVNKPLDMDETLGLLRELAQELGFFPVEKISLTREDFMTEEEYALDALKTAQECTGISDEVNSKLNIISIVEIIDRIRTANRRGEYEVTVPNYLLNGKNKEALLDKGYKIYAKSMDYSIIDFNNQIDNLEPIRELNKSLGGVDLNNNMTDFPTSDQSRNKAIKSQDSVSSEYLQHIKSLINEATDNGQTFVKIDRKYLTITNMDLLTDKGY